MAHVAMTPQEQREYVSEHMDADMQFVASEAGVHLDHQVAIARYYGSLRKFGAIADDRAGVRAACLHDFAIPQDTPVNRSQVAAIVTAWETAKELVAKETEIRAEAKGLGQPRILQTHERQAMMKAVEALYGVIPDAEAPRSDFIDHRGQKKLKLMNRLLHHWTKSSVVRSQLPHPYNHPSTLQRISV